MRYFLIDKVTELDIGKSVRGITNVTLTDEILHDHFPDHPIMPGALILESASQLAGFLLEMTVNKPDAPLRRSLLVQVDLAKFHDFAGPGDQLDIHVTLDSLHEGAAKVTAEVKDENEKKDEEGEEEEEEEEDQEDKGGGGRRRAVEAAPKFPQKNTDQSSGDSTSPDKGTTQSGSMAAVVKGGFQGTISQ